MAQKLVKYVTQEEFESMLKEVKDKKIKLAMLLGFEAGLRISEIVGLYDLGSQCCKAKIIKEKVNRLGVQKKVIAYKCSACSKILSIREMCRSKNFGWEIEPLRQERVKDSMLEIVGAKGEKDRVVPRPKRMNEKAVALLPLEISRRTLQRAITELGLKILKKDISFHSLRHGFGSHMAGQGRPLHEIQMFMGHSRLDTTGIYLHSNPQIAAEKAREIF